MKTMPNDQAIPMTPAIEIEQKFRLDDAVAFEHRLLKMGAVLVVERVESDHYHNAPDRDFAATGEAFRLRRCDEENVLTYKGPKEATAAMKVRPEIELDIANGDAGAAIALEMLKHLGYRPVAVVRKLRRLFHLNRDGIQVTITNDHCDHVGTFAEIEIVTNDGERTHAIAIIESLAKELDLNQPEPRSYLRMLLETRAIS